MPNRFERILWGSRYLVLAGVISCMLAATVIFILGFKDLLHLCELLWSYFSHSSHDIRNQLIMVVVEILDTFLLGSILLIFSFGLYELFISDLEEASKDGTGGKVLVITSIDSLKSKLGKVILMMLIIKVFSYFSEIKPTTPLELLYMGGIVMFVALALMLTKHQDG